MNQRKLFALWGVMFIVCAGLGFIPEPTGLLRGILMVCALAFFVPGAMIAYRGYQQRDRHSLKLVRNLAAASLGLTLALLVLSVLTALQSEAFGDALYCVLAIVSTPMVCSGYWALSLFLWACLLVGSFEALRKCQTSQEDAK